MPILDLEAIKDKKRVHVHSIREDFSYEYVAMRSILLSRNANQSVSKTFRYVLELKGTIFKLFNFLLQRYSALIASLILHDCSCQK